MDKKQFTETDIITKYILPSVVNEGWDTMTPVRRIPLERHWGWRNN